jgi:hypothetical protein
VSSTALAAVGGTLDGVRLIGEGTASHAFNPGGGLHHAHRERADSGGRTPDKLGALFDDALLPADPAKAALAEAAAERVKQTVLPLRLVH